MSDDPTASMSEARTYRHKCTVLKRKGQLTNIPWLGDKMVNFSSFFPWGHFFTMKDGHCSPLIIFRLFQSASWFKIRLFSWAWGQEKYVRKRGTQLEPDQGNEASGEGSGIPYDLLDVGKKEWKATNNRTASLFCCFHAYFVFVNQILTHLTRNTLYLSSKAGCQYRRNNVRVISIW